MIQIGDRILVAESDLSHVAVFDLDFNLVSTIGKFGEGPDDFYYLGALGQIDESRFYVHDRGHNLLRVFNLEGNVYPSVPVPESSFAKNFMIYDSLIHYAAMGREKPFQCRDFYGVMRHSFGDFVGSYNNNYQREYRSVGVNHSFDGQFVTVRPSEPEILLFDRDWKNIYSLNLFDLHFMANYRDRWKDFNFANQANSTMAIVRDSYVHNGKLYLLTFSSIKGVDNENILESNKVVVVKVGDNRLEFDGAFELAEESESYSQIMVFDGFIYVFDEDGGKIDQFEIE